MKFTWTALLLALFCLSTSFQSLTRADNAPNGNSDIPADILNILLSVGIQVTHIEAFLSAGLRWQAAAKFSTLLKLSSFDATHLAENPVPLVEITIDQVTAEYGTNGTSFFTFNQTFTNFIISGPSTANSGLIPNVNLAQGGLATLEILSEDELDIISATYELRVLTVNGTGGLPLSLPASQIDVPAKLDFQCP
ncbi:hypothetical protein DFH11DRAFT_1544092 [Phellopilus nigrolimitatus]|nr:hypothetical protein DFH11DRAFT_1544092 [Phellopilus nigrolimitatus]